MIELPAVRAAHRLPELKQALLEAGYTLEGAAEFCGLRSASDELLRRTASVSLRYADPLEPGCTALEALITVLWLQGVVGAEAFDACVPPDIRELLVTLGIIRHVRPGRIEAAVSLIEYKGSYLLADRLFVNDFEEGLQILDSPDVTMPLHASSMELLDVAMLEPASSSLLELGCGCGGTAIARSALHDRCMGLDLNPRSVGFANANAMLNSAPVEFVLGDALHDPTPARTWDLVLFNTPSEPHYDNVARALSFGDAELRMLLGTTIPALLAPGGAAIVHVLVPVTDDRGEDGWFADRVPASFDVTVEPVEQSPFAVSAEDIRAGRLGGGHFALRHPDDAPQLLAWLRHNAIRELVTCITTIRAKP